MIFMCRFYINPHHSLVFSQDLLRSNMEFTCGPARNHLRANLGIVCGPGSLAVLYLFEIQFCLKLACTPQ